MSRQTSKPSLRKAQQIICAGVKPVGSESADLLDCLHRVVRRDVISRRPHPLSDSAARDGYCLSAATTGRASAAHPAVLRIRATIRSGDRPQVRIGREDCVRIMTGGVVPEGADAVIPLEEASAEGGYVRIPHPVKPETHIYRTGRIAKAGQTVARKGDFVSPGLLGLLAAVGLRRLRVSRRVRVGIISTGNEVVGRGRSPRAWQVRDSNWFMLAGLAEELGTEVVNLGIAGDSGDDIARCLRAGKECDLVLLTGGSSAGIFDLVPGALERHGCRLLVRGVRLRPGKHVVFAGKGKKVFFGLPGRPGGCFTLFHVLVRPAVMAMMGRACFTPAALRAVWQGGVTEKPSVDTLIAARLDAGSGVRPVSDTGTGDLAAVARSNSLVLMRAGRGYLRKGDTVEVLPVRLP